MATPCSPLGGLGHLVAARREHARERVADLGVVVDDEDGGWLRWLVSKVRLAIWREPGFIRGHAWLVNQLVPRSAASSLSLHFSFLLLLAYVC